MGQLDADLDPRWVRTRAEREWLAAIRDLGLTSWSMRASDKRRTWGPEIYRLLELDEQPPLGVGLLMCVPESREVIGSCINTALARGLPFDAALTMITAKGRTIHVRSRGVPLIVGGVPVAIAGLFVEA